MHLADVAPMLISSRPVGLSEPGWIYELKFDGYRLLAEFGAGTVELKTGSGADATTWFPEITKSLASMHGGPFITDGEVCVLDDLGRSNFDLLQIRARRRRWHEGADPVTYCVFDLLVHRGIDITRFQLIQRKALLAKLFKLAPPNILYVSYFDGGAQDLFNQAVMTLKLDGLVSKRAASVYAPGTRSRDWVKVKRKGDVPRA